MNDRVEDLLEQYLDPKLRGVQVDVEDLIAAHPELEEPERERLRRLAGLLGEPADVGSQSFDPASPMRDQVGPYSIVRELGRGAQGTVFLAVDNRFARKVALKVLTHHGMELRDDAQGRESTARLKREAEVVSRLNHPGICVVYEMGAERNDRYIAMRYVEGETLSKRIAAARANRDPQAKSAARQALRVVLPGVGEHETGPGTPPSSGRTSVDRILALVEECARALHAAHEAGVVHRDVKPGNIMVTPEGEPVLLDFGLASDLEHATSALTLSGGLLGTPAYMSPEQLSPSHGSVDRRADVYALGVTLYECLTLERPFHGPTRETLYRSILTERPPEARGLNASVPRDLGVLLEIAMEKDVRHRYQTALDLAEDLRRVREQQPIRARPAGILKRGTRWSQRNPVLASTIAGLFLVLATGLALSLHLLGREQSMRRKAEGRGLLADSRAVLANSPCLALLLAIEAAPLAPGLAARNALLDAIGELREKRMLQTPGPGLSHCVPSPDGRFLVTTANDGSAQVWDAETWKLVKDLRGHTAGISGAVFSPDGRLLATAAADGTCRVWNTATWSSLHILREPYLSVGVHGFDPSSRYLLTVTSDESDGSVHVWDIEREVVLCTLEGESRDISDCSFAPHGVRILLVNRSEGIRVWQVDGATPRWILELPNQIPDQDLRAIFSPDGRKLLASGPGGASLWDVETRTKLHFMKSQGRGGGPLAFRRDGQRMLVAHADTHRAELWDASSGNRVCELAGSRIVVRGATFSPDGTRILACASDHTAGLWDAETGEELATFAGHEASISHAHFSSSGLSVITASPDGTVREWSPESEGQRSTYFPARGKFARACFDPAGGRFAAVTESGSLRMIDPDCPTESSGFEIPAGDGLRSLVFAPDGRSIVVVAHEDSFHTEPENVARSRDTETGAVLAVFKHPKDARVYDAQLSPDGGLVVTAASDCMARVWDAKSGKLVQELAGHVRGVRSAAFDRTGKRVVTASEVPEDASVRIWDWERGTEISTLGAERERPISACFSPDGQRVLAACWWGQACVWDVSSGKLIQRWPASYDHLLSAGYSPDGTMILTTSSGATRLWDAETFEELLTLDARRTGVTSGAFSADGRWVVTTSHDGAARIWPVDPLRRARELAPRRLTPSERERYGLAAEERP